MNSFQQRHLLPAVHRILGLCLILAFASAQSYAQFARIGPTVSNPNSAEVQRIDVSGTVVNSVTGEAIARALVTLGGSEVHSMLTDTDGRFAFEKVPAQNIYLTARRPGFFDRPQVLVRTDSAKSVVVKMTPAGLIFGQVVDENGDPVESAQVRLLQQRLVMGKKRWAGASGAQTNDRGRYRLPNLRPGRYIIAVLPNGNRTLDVGKTGYATVFYPKAPDPASAAPISISAGEQSEADFELSPVMVYKVSGVVTGPKTQGIGINLMSGSGDETALFARLNPATGEFEIRGVPKGTYTLRAQGSTEQGEQLSARATVTVNNDLSGIVLVLHPPIEIPIEVRNESSQLGAQNPRNGIPGLNIQPISMTDEQAGGYSNFEGSPGNGRYVLHLPESGTYNLVISSYGPGYVRSATSGGTDLLNEPLVVPSSGNASPIEVVLASDGATVSGVVRGGEGYGLVIAVPDDENRQPTMSGYSSARQFRFSSLAPGDYTIYAIRPSQDVDYSDRDALKPFRSKAAHVTLAPNQTTEVTLDLIETEQ